MNDLDYTNTKINLDYLRNKINPENYQELEIPFEDLEKNPPYYFFINPKKLLTLNKKILINDFTKKRYKLSYFKIMNGLFHCENISIQNILPIFIYLTGTTPRWAISTLSFTLQHLYFPGITLLSNIEIQVGCLELFDYTRVLKKENDAVTLPPYKTDPNFLNEFYEKIFFNSFKNIDFSTVVSFSKEKKIKNNTYSKKIALQQYIKKNNIF